LVEHADLFRNKLLAVIIVTFRYRFRNEFGDACDASGPWHFSRDKSSVVES
jgi:hypothetical protein